MKNIAKKVLSSILAIMIALFSHGYFPLNDLSSHLKNAPKPRVANAENMYFPTGGGIITGTNPSRRGLTVPAATGVNTGDWRGALAKDNYHFGITPNAVSGYAAYIDIDGVDLRGANEIGIQTGIALTATAAQTLVQICDWSSSAGVSNAADAQCTGGGWRTLNLSNAAITATGASEYDWMIYDGYFESSATSSYSTPLANFLDSTGKIRVRYYSTTASAGNAYVDYLRVSATVNPVYSPSGATVRSDGAPVGDYENTIIGGVGQTGTDATYFAVPGATKAADYYFSFKNVRAYSGANTILIRSTHSCSATDATIVRPDIYNFTTGQWQDLTTANITCSTTNATDAWVATSTALQDFLSGGEIRVGWHALSVSATQVRTDVMYIMIGGTTGGTQEISLGTVNTGTSVATRDIDTTGTANLWITNAVAKSNTQSTSFYGYDNDGTATAGNAAAENMDFTLQPPSNAGVSGIYFASRFRAGAAGTVAVGLQDVSGLNSAQGGWTQVGTAATNALTYSDNYTAATNASGGMAGVYANATNYISHENGAMNLRLRTTTSSASAFAPEWDFALLALSWVEDSDHRTRTGEYTPTGGAIVTGSDPAHLGLTAPAATGVNTGGWRGALADDNYHYGITSTTGGYNAYLDFDGAYRNGANKIIIQSKLVEAATAAQTLVQICDWVSATGVDKVADTQCTGGGWRTLNVNKTAIAPTSATAYDFEIYDGYWSSNATTKISTPISNFISGTKIRVRFFSTTNTTANIYIDYARLFVIVDPVYSASGATLIQASDTTTGTYASSTIGGAGQTGIDNAYFTVAGTASVISDFYLSHTGVRMPTGANTIMYRANYSCTATGPLIKPKIYNFNTSLWEDLTTTAIACSTTAATNAWAKYSTTISNYVSNGEIRIGWYGSAASTVGVRIDMSYIMVGAATNNTTSLTYGTVSAGTAANTQTLDMTGTLSSWNITSVAKSNTQVFAFNAYDNDATASAGAAVSPNIDFTLTPPSGSEVTGIFYAARYMSGTTGTVVAGIEDLAGFTSAQGGWSQVCTTSTTALTFCDSISAGTVASGGAAGWYTNPQDYVDPVTGRMNMRLRTSAFSTAGAVAQWDFAMMSYSWIDTPVPSGSLTFSISGSHGLNFGALSSVSAKYATDGGSGSVAEAPAHTISASSNASGGYVITLSGSSPTYGATSLASIGGVATTSIPGTEQFGIRLVPVGGSGFARSPYSSSLYAFDPAGHPEVAASVSSDNVNTDYSVYYLANIAGLTDAGQYTGTLSYTMTAGF